MDQIAFHIHLLTIFLKSYIWSYFSKALPTQIQSMAPNQSSLSATSSTSDTSSNILSMIFCHFHSSTILIPNSDLKNSIESNLLTLCDFPTFDLLLRLLETLCPGLSKTTLTSMPKIPISGSYF